MMLFFFSDLEVVLEEDEEDELLSELSDDLPQTSYPADVWSSKQDGFLATVRRPLRAFEADTTPLKDRRPKKFTKSA